MGCCPNKDYPPEFILVERLSDEDEPTIEDFDYDVGGKLLNQVKRGPDGSPGSFIAVYKLVDARFVTTETLDISAKNHISCQKVNE